MLTKKTGFVILLLAAAAAAYLILFFKGEKGPYEEMREIKPARGAIKSVISTTGTILPKNRLEIKPPVNGRVEEMLVKEGEKIKVGQILAWMSSTERAALVDAARGKGEEELKYWKEAYKPIPLISPIDGEVIVATTQPGQTVITGDAVVVLSDHLIARAQVDETDIGKIKLKQEAVITLDAYPDKKVNGKVGHIYYESETVNNVTVYKVDVIPQEEVLFFRSGMNAMIDFKEDTRPDSLLLPQEAVSRDKEGSWVLLKRGNSREPEKRAVKLGNSDENNVEIIFGLDDSDTVVVKSTEYKLPTAATSTNPFMPKRR
ncbi:MAG: HlyD family efflux transporter periplasmic adaptor subunit [Candidatus Omnitrophota bacterium]|jgi:macrolide-specific efflux system membrane fusion protein